MASVLNLLLFTVIVGLMDGQRLALENPEFIGFIESRNGTAVLLYRHVQFQGEISVDRIQRIDMGYRRGSAFPLTVTLRNGQRLEVESARRNYLMLKGEVDGGLITVKHPDPISARLELGARPPDRRNDLTIQYLEFPAN